MLRAHTFAYERLLVRVRTRPYVIWTPSCSELSPSLTFDAIFVYSKLFGALKLWRSHPSCSSR
eukprot:scaffold187481_cov41-Prasinocladus_malaysianus.AAC.2